MDSKPSDTAQSGDGSQASAVFVFTVVLFGTAGLVTYTAAYEIFPYVIGLGVAIVLGAAGLALRSRRNEATVPSVQPPPLPTESPRKRWDETLRQARAAAEANARLKAQLDEQHRSADLLTRARCFYMHDGEQRGPVTFWQVHELIEMDLLTPDVQVIAEGSDYWRTYAEWELLIVPPATVQFEKLRRAAHLQCFYRQGETEIGPVSLLAIFHYIRYGKLPKDVLLRAAETADWKRACDI